MQMPLPEHCSFNEKIEDVSESVFDLPIAPDAPDADDSAVDANAKKALKRLEREAARERKSNMTEEEKVEEQLRRQHDPVLGWVNK